MKSLPSLKESLESEGFAIINTIYSKEEIDSILQYIATADADKPTFRKTNDLFAIRQFLKELPGIYLLIFTDKLNQLIWENFGEDYFVTKSIYFDKPPQSNWFVSYHQDLTISVNEKVEMAGFGPWTVKQDQFAVLPPLEILENNFTIRIHLDDTDEQNGALKVIPGSHKKGIYRPETIDWSAESECICNVQAGGLMLMRPLLLHSSSRTTNNKSRRVIHIELSNQQLPEPLRWSEKL